MTDTARQRHLKRNPCRICGGGDNDRRGQSKRCSGYSEGDWILCSREEYAGGLSPNDGGLYAHRASGPCKCGTQHAPEEGLTKRQIRDREGHVVADHVRKDYADGTKRYWWERAGIPGLGGLPEATLPLYNTDLVAKWPAGKPGLVLEGEKDCDALVKHGIPAVANVLGAPKAHGRPAYEVLKGHPMILWPDNDDVGREQMRRTAQHLAGIAAGVKVFEWKDAGPKEGAHDYFARGGTKEKLLEELKQAVPVDEWLARLPSQVQAAERPQAPTTNNSHAEGSTVEHWIRPIPLNERAVAAFPSGIFPRWLRDWVLAESVATQTPVDLPGMLSLSVLSTACAGKLRLRVRPGFEEPLNTFIVVVLPPANRKTAVFRDSTAPGMEFEREEVERLRESIGQAAQRRRVLERRLDRAERDAAKARNDVERAKAAGDADSVRRELSEVHVPAEPRFFVDDVTPEKATMMLAEQGGRLAQLSPEGGPFDMMAGRYSGTPNFEVYLKGHAGDVLRVDRAGRASDSIPNPALTVGLAVQPEVIRGLMARSDFRGRGLVGRFLYSLPRSPLGRRQVGAPPVPESVRSTYHSGVRALFKLPFGTDAQGAPTAHVLCFDAEADRSLVEFERELEPRLGPHGDLGWMGDWAGKLAGQLARVSGLLHMTDAAGLSAPWEVPVSGDCVRRAVTLGRYLIAHAQAAYGAMGADPDVAGGDHLLGWLERTRPKAFTKRDAHQENRGRFQHADEVGPALELLEEHGYIRQVLADEKPDKRPGRKPSPTYEVNPLAFGDAPGSQNARNTHNGQTAQHSEYCEESESEGRRVSAAAPAGADGGPR